MNLALSEIINEECHYHLCAYLSVDTKDAHLLVVEAFLVSDLGIGLSLMV